MLSMFLSLYGVVAVIFMIVMLIALAISYKEFIKDTDTPRSLIALILVMIVIVSAVWPAFVVYMFIHRKDDENESEMLENSGNE